MIEACELTLTDVKDVLKRWTPSGVLRSGNHSGPTGPDDTCEVCVREARALACALKDVGDWRALSSQQMAQIWREEVLSKYNDHPDGKNASPTDRMSQGLNDAAWSSDEARTAGCMPLALLTEAHAPKDWIKAVAEQTIRQIVPIALRAAADIHPHDKHQDALRAAALLCESEGTPAAAAAAAAWAAEAAEAAWEAAAAWARAAAEAEAAAARDKVLRVAVRIVLRAHGREDLVAEMPAD